MAEMLIGAITGAGIVAVCWAFQAWSSKTNCTIEQEKTMGEVQHKVDEIVTMLERIIYQPRQ